MTLPQTSFAGGKCVPCISPDDVFSHIVYCQCVGPAKVVADDVPLFGDRSVHPDAPDVSVIAPVRVEQPALVRVNLYRTRLLQTLLHQHLKPDNTCTTTSPCTGEPVSHKAPPDPASPTPETRQHMYNNQPLYG